jgi:acetyl-CoA C-acetyltransferase
MAEAYIIDAIRTPVGRKKGSLSQEHPADLGGHVLKAIVERNQIDPLIVEDVIFGCVDTIGPQAGNIARTCWVVAGLPEEVPGTTVDRQCGSSQQAIHFAAQAVMSGTNDVVIAGGVQQMNLIPISSAMTCAESLGFTDPIGRDDRGKVELLARGHGALRPREPRAGAARHRRGALQEGDRPLRRLRYRRDAAEVESREDGHAQGSGGRR